MPIKAASKDEDLLGDLLNFIVDMADKAVADQNPDLAKCVLDDLAKLTTNDKLLKLPKARLQDIHTKASYVTRKLKPQSTAHHNAIITPWMATLEDKSVKSEDKPKSCK
jgi:hypothetical protein